MSQTNSVAKQRFPTFRRWLARLGKLPFLSRAWWKRNARRMAFACLFLIALWMTANIYATFALNRELAAIKQRGEPLTFAKLSPEISSKENAAVVYEKAFKLLRYEKHENPAMLGLAYDASGLTPLYTFATRERIFSRNRATTQLIFQAVKMPKYQVKADFSSGADTERAFSSYSHMREFARFMSAQADHETRRGRREQAFRCIAAIYRMSEQVAQDPSTIGMLVAIAMENIGHAALARVLDSTPLSLDEAQNAIAQLPHNNWERALQRTLWSERINALPYFQGSESWWKKTNVASDDASAEGFFPMTVKERVSFHLFAPLRKLDGAAYLRLDPTKSNAQIPRYATMTRIVSPILISTRQNTERAQDMRKMARIALALKLWRQTHSNYPKSLQELKSMPIASLQSALSHKTVGYKMQDDKFLLYSFGINRTDDGGKSNRYNPFAPDSQALNENDDDLPWRQSLGIRKTRN